VVQSALDNPSNKLKNIDFNSKMVKNPNKQLKKSKYEKVSPS
jgi:hypothetical protein